MISEIQFSAKAESELEHLREVFDKISDDITNSTEKESFEIYSKTLGIEFTNPVKVRFKPNWNPSWVPNPSPAQVRPGPDETYAKIGCKIHLKKKKSK